MENTKLKKILIITIIISIIIVIIFFILKNNLEQTNTEITEYTPQEELTEEQTRQTMVTLYYENKETKALMPEARLIDARLLSKNPYLTLINMLIQEPKSDKLQSAIPEGTKINKTELKGDVVYVDLSIEFIQNQEQNIEQQSLSIYSIVNTLTELTEVNAIKILIDGKEDTSFPNNGMSLKEIFIRMD